MKKTLEKSLKALAVAQKKNGSPGQTPRIPRRRRDTVEHREEKTEHHSPIAPESNNTLQLT
jgi:hypothetical protein